MATPRRVVSAAFTLALVAACGDPVSAPVARDAPAVAATKAAASIPLAVTVEDQGASGPYRIQSDGLGEYVNGVQTVTAEIDGYGNLQFGPELSTSLARTIRFDFSDPVDPLNAYRPDETSPQQLWRFTTNPNVVPGAPRIMDLGVNGNPVSACYGAVASHRNATTRYPAYYNTAVDPQSTTVYVTRTNVNVSPAEWTMVTDGPCVGIANHAGLHSQVVSKSNTPIVFRGYYNLPFSLRLRAL